jgi:hypothetical protein
VPNYQNLMFDSKTAGLAQINDVSFSVAVPSLSMTSGLQDIIIASAAMGSSNAIPDVQVRLTGLSTKWFWLSPRATYYYPDGTTAATDTFSFTMVAYFSGSTVNVRLTSVNDDFVTNTRPAFTLDCRAYVDEAPF